MSYSRAAEPWAWRGFSRGVLGMVSFYPNRLAQPLERPTVGSSAKIPLTSRGRMLSATRERSGPYLAGLFRMSRRAL